MPDLSQKWLTIPIYTFGKLVKPSQQHKDYDFKILRYFLDNLQLFHYIL